VNVSVAVGHVTRKDGRIVEFPDAVNKMLKWLTGLSLVTPVIMLLISFGSPKAGAPIWLGVLLTIFPIGTALMILSNITREGMRGNIAFGSALALLNYCALTIDPHTDQPIEMLLTRGWPIVGIIAVLYFFRIDLHYNLRPIWFSMKAMRQMQEMMMQQKMAKDAKKRGETYDPKKTIDAEAIVRAMQAKTGKDVPAHMAGISTKPGFREKPKGQQGQGNKNSGGGGGGKKKGKGKKGKKR